ncbi:EAL domain-containing protein [Shewanella sp. MBTL60-007]|uniref:EAL domain-containing protein n=1 Tax=Shewanella sp. MBTL60-007 TaxID=2815911 RepID=UPI001BC2E7C6|nr:EAL domain-containing protein [Shewanella sp. MBTL60-007]GIU33134.1 EAL domain-containing protein [Shewanella sp. MBTL60-007]
MRNCFFKGHCGYSSEICVNGDKNGSLPCSHFHVGQHITDRSGRLYGIEVLSRPIDFTESIELEQYYSLMLPSKHNWLIIELANKIYHIEKSMSRMGSQSYFLNVERFSLMDRSVVESLCTLNRRLKRFNSFLIVEITERNEGLSPYTIEAEYVLKDSDVLIALDDFTYESAIVLDDTRHDFLKLDMRYINNNKENEQFIDWLYDVNQIGVKVIAERVETKIDYLLAQSLPISYFQGYYRGLLGC